MTCAGSQAPATTMSWTTATSPQPRRLHRHQSHHSQLPPPRLGCTPLSLLPHPQTPYFPRQGHHCMDPQHLCARHRPRAGYWTPPGPRRHPGRWPLPRSR
uniref:Uncharacterized protein n=1 Tax=Arundo donax TaxID=35708 RepID=A0A0A9DP18_ARUDO